MNDSIDEKGAAVAHAEKAAELLAKVREGIGRVIFGQKEVIDQTLITLMAGGHGLLIGVPGLAKTKLVEALGTVLGLDWKRIQFTPDLMPADITGSEVLEEVDDRHRAFRFLKGPVFTQLLMADEINRASPRTQSALLQSMQERQVTVAGERYDLPVPFHVLATQNPLEQEGTYPLPEAQLDRFLLQIDVEKHMLLSTTFGDETAPQRVCGPEALIAAQAIVRRLPVGEKVVDSILRLVRAARPDADGAPELRDIITWGPSPRASQAFMLAARARALIEGRLSPSTDDVAALAGPVLRHRMAISFAARAEGLTVVGVIDRLCQTLL
jgi:MoxR-like ATPase